MGDRSNIVVKSKYSTVYLYGHDMGLSYIPILQSALLRGTGRFNDATYLGRIIFCEMVKGRETDILGFGISSRLTDNEHPLLVVDCDKQEVRLTTEKGKRIAKMSIGEFCNSTELFETQAGHCNYK